MLTYRDRLLTEATLEAADELGSISEALQYTGHKTLATIARTPEVIKAVNSVREYIPKDRWNELDTPSAKMTDDERHNAVIVWQAMPGYCCIRDAVTILARL